MAISYSITKHAYAFQSKLLAANGGNHIYNVRLTSDMDNGTIIAKGDWVGFDEYEQSIPENFLGTIVDQASNGNYYVEVVDPGTGLLVLEVPEIAENYNAKFTDPKNFYNKAGETVRAYGLSIGDIFELSAEGFTTTPSAASVGKSVTVSTAQGKVGKLEITV